MSVLTIAFIVDSVPFTKAVIAGETSLGGSESACLGLARALAARGHDVHIFTTQLAPDAAGKDHAGVEWHPYDEFAPMNQFIEWDVVCPLRMFAAYTQRPVYARLRLLWNQDLLVPGQMQLGVMSVAWAYDHLCYVSDYHRAQWEDLQPELKGLGWVTRNGFDPSQVPTSATKDPNRIIHISRPERGLGPLLAMWPALKQQHPDATLRVCRYSSMYDQGPGSWTDVCQQWDARLAAVNEQVGGITYLGELNKPQLYQEIAEAAVMWYPGVSTFAETSCIAAVEAQACGTPFVGSYRGALPETVPTGVLIKGDHRSPQYQEQSISAVVELLEQCQHQAFDYRKRQTDGRKHVKAHHTYAVLAEQWETQIEAWFTERYQANKVRVMRQLLHEDDHVAAKVVAGDILDEVSKKDREEAETALAFCDYVIAGKDQTAEQYGEAAIQDPLVEAETSGRFKLVAPIFEKCTSILDCACGNGSFAIALTKANPTIRVHGLDYSAQNIDHAKDGAERAGVADRCTFEQVTVYDFDTQDLHADWLAWAAGGRSFDALFVGEFIEHVGHYRALIDGLEAVLVDGAQVVYTCPHGAFAELYPKGPHAVPLRRGHVHRFHHDDLRAVWGTKLLFWADYLAGGLSERGTPLGNWMIRYTKAPDRPCGFRPLEARIKKTRPYQKLSIGMIVKDAENDLGRCLWSINKVVDELIIGDTGSTDDSKAIAASYGATVIDLPTIDEHPDGFAGARNAVLAQCTGDWFLWIDADEQLMHGHWLRRYLDGTVFNGYVIPQTHLYLDAPPTSDIPVRVFRPANVQFYGCIHEQPQHGDANGDIHPTLQVGDLKIAHTGYLTEEGREVKRVERNLPLLIRDAKVFGDRVLSKVLQIREAVIQSDHHRARNGGQMTPRAQEGYAHAVQMFVQAFDDPAHKYHKLARPWYEAALRHLGIGWEQEIAMAGKQGGLGGHQARHERLWVRDGAEYTRLMAFKVQEMAKGMTPVTFVTDPDDLRPVEHREQVSA